MKVQDIPVIEFINNANRTFVIPVYQRNYSWNVKNCDKLFEDAVDAYRNGKDHYFGNVVYYSIDADMANAYFRLALIDGQQRVTSIMLLIAAIRDSEKDNNVRKSISDNYLLNRTGDEKERVKLKQVQTDRKVYEDIINGVDIADDDRSSNVYKNYKEFCKLVRQSDLSTSDLLNMLRRLIIVAVDLQLSNNSSSESPQIIFESINATGQPLSVVDLLRNYLLLGISERSQEDYYDRYWLPIERNTSLYIKGNASTQDFVNRYLEMYLTDSVKRGEEYEVFKKNMDNMFESCGDVLEDMYKFSKYYRVIKCPTDNSLSKELVSALCDINELRSDGVVSLLMWLFDQQELSNTELDHNFSDVVNSIRVLESWLFRARVAGTVSSGAISHIPVRLLRLLKDGEVGELFEERIRYILSNYETGDIWPSDEVFASAFMEYDFYNNYKNYVMRKLEHYMSNDRVNFVPDTIEHILPQKLTEYWKNVLGPDYATLHAHYLNTIGNLAPLNKGENSAAQNDTFTAKREFYKKSSWILTRDVAECSDWGVTEIENRARALSETALKLWPGPQKREVMVRAFVRTTSNVRDLDRIPDGSVFTRRVDSPSCYVDAHAVVRHNADGDKNIVLLSGSIINRNVKAGLNGVMKLRNELRDSLFDDGEKITTIKDIAFDLSKPSGLSRFVLGREDNGWTTWVDENGHSLDDYANVG